jgi:hypothetical protein
MTTIERPANNRDWDGYTAVIASLIGLLALLVSGYTAWLQHKQVSAQVWPRLQLVRYAGKHAFVARSQGVGPARIKTVRVTVDAKPVRMWRDMFAALGMADDYAQSQLAGTVLPPGQDLEVLRTPEGPAGEKTFETLSHLLYNSDAPHHIGVMVCYCSVLDQCWVTAIGKKNLPDMVKEVDEPARCPIAPADRFDQ